MKWLSIIPVLLFVSSCSDSYENQQQALVSFVNKKQLGSSKDYWLTKKNMLGEWEKTVLVFGHMDDYDVCNDLASLYMSKYPLDKYSCMATN